MEGLWDGTWLSDVNGHTGRLRCILTRDDSGTLQARYHATYGGFFTFEYTAPMSVRSEGDVLAFTAEADLGWLAGGRYEYTGTVEGNLFRATYTSKNDHGTYEMKRVHTSR